MAYYSGRGLGCSTKTLEFMVDQSQVRPHKGTFGNKPGDIELPSTLEVTGVCGALTSDNFELDYRWQLYSIHWELLCAYTLEYETKRAKVVVFTFQELRHGFFEQESCPCGRLLFR